MIRWHGGRRPGGYPARSQARNTPRPASVRPRPGSTRCGSVLTTATLDLIRHEVPGVAVDERRFRPNVLVRTPPGTPPFVEDEWIGREAMVGDTLRVEFLRSSERCVMTNQAQRDLPDRDPGNGPRRGPPRAGWNPGRRDRLLMSEGGQS